MNAIPKRALVFGHRGASHDAPMNTLPAFELALAQGADGVELDVQLTRDGHLVVIHDESVDATTNGHGFVRDMTLAQLRELDSGSWFGSQFANTQIPTLDEVFETLGRRIIINVEIKSKSLRPTNIEAKVAEVIRRHAMQKHVIVSSFNPMALRRFRKQMPDVDIGYLHAPNLPFYLSWLMLGIAYQADHPYEQSVDEQYMQNARLKNHPVNVWTVNDPERARVLNALGVHSIMTDMPAVIIEALSRP
ncbi:MAG: glycerophosphodiester phosphodiesterase [Chloroflexi bacterium]|nr:MAG: glycerophosphodiester phosphodiesterase [Chloroflexota bacterium]